MKAYIKNPLLLPGLLASLGLIPAGRVTAQTFTTLHSFINGSDGSGPYAGLILSGATLYGTAVSGGNPGAGTVFAINTNGTGFTTLHHFTGGGDGGNPYASLISSGNTLYGTTWGGGTLGYGTVFAVNTNGSGFTNLHSFTATSGALSTNSDGVNPFGALILIGTTLYGTARGGGSSGKGTVFAVNTNGSGFTTLHSFTATSGPLSTNSDGTVPQAGLILSGSTLYGTANSGGSSGYGTVFALNTNGSGFTTLHHFDWDNDGAYPHALLLSGNTLYGTANAGGSAGYGTVFALNTNGTGFRAVYTFTEENVAANPFSGLVLSGNTLYGAALGGGSSGKGAVFAVRTNGTDFTALHTFTATSGPSSTNSDGANPRAGLILSGNTLYGTTDRGGSAGYGTVFSLSLQSRPQLTVIPSGANVTLTWPTNAAAFTLESATNLSLPNSWSSVGQPALTNSGQISVTVPTADAQKFFRLRWQ